MRVHCELRNSLVLWLVVNYWKLKPCRMAVHEYHILAGLRRAGMHPFSGTNSRCRVTSTRGGSIRRHRIVVGGKHLC